MKYNGKLLDGQQMVKHIVNQSGKSAYQLSSEIGVSKNTVRRWECGYSPSLRDFEKFLINCGYEIKIIKKSDWRKI
jgi:transcriptional regulator with XRE-family HTH domain